jgi:hypothetical protein
VAERAFILPKLLPRDQAICRIVDACEDLPISKAWRVSIEESKSSRSILQNAYLNGVCYKLIGDAIGYERDEVSEFLCGTYFGWKEKRVPKKPGCPSGIESVPIRTTTTDAEGRRSVLGKTEFSEYVAFVQRFGASKGIVIPDPDPDYADHQDEAEAA